MNYKDHCNLCENVKFNLQEGIICELTNQKPTFKKVCSKIQLGEKLKNELELILIKFERMKKKKKSIYTWFFIEIIIGCSLILGANSMVKYAFLKSVFISKIVIVIISIGFGLCGLAYLRLKNYNQKTKTIKSQINTINKVLDKYDIKYSFDIMFGKKYHGNQDITVEIKSKNILLKNSKTTYQLKSI